MRFVTSRCLAAAALAAASLLAVAPAGAGGSARRIAQVFLTGHGTVTSAPRGIACPGACRGLFPRDADVHLVAHAAPGWRFAGWGGDCSGSLPACTFQLASSHDCAARVCTIAVFDVRARFVSSS